MKQFIYCFVCLFTVLSYTTTFAQSCTNYLKNHDAKEQGAHWKFYNNRGAFPTNANGNDFFTITPSGTHITQDVKIPEGSSLTYINGWVRNEQNNVQVGNADLHAYIIDDNNRILSQVHFFDANRTNEWRHLVETKDLPDGAKTVRLILRYAPNDTNQPITNIAYFDNLVVAFDCKLSFPKPVEKQVKCKNYLLNSDASDDEAKWRFYGKGAGVTITENRNKSFIITAAGTHITQDIEIPVGSRSVYAGGWVKNGLVNVQNSNVDLHFYIMDGEDNILAQSMLFGDDRNANWQYHAVLKNLPAGAKHIRLILSYVPSDVENKIYFDNLVVSFDCKLATARP